MSKETEIEEVINPTPKQTEFTVALPDREKQWEKCPAIIKKTKTVTQITREVVDGETKDTPSTPQIIEYTEMALEDKGVGAHGEALKTPVKLSEIQKKIVDASVIEAAKPDPKTQTDAEKKQVALSASLASTFADKDGKVEEKKLKEQASWGLGCPANCGGFREFTYGEMVPQTYKCAVCRVTIHLV